MSRQTMPERAVAFLRNLVPLGLGTVGEQSNTNPHPNGFGAMFRDHSNDVDASGNHTHDWSPDNGKTTFAPPTYNPDMPNTPMSRSRNFYPGGPGISKAILEKAQQNFIHNDAAGDVRLGGRFTPAGLNKSVVDANNNAADLTRSRQMIGIGGTLAPNFGKGNF